MREGNAKAVGCDGKEKQMNAMTHSAALSHQTVMPIVLVALFGAALLFTTGLAGASALHDAAHDVRHSIGFACH